MTRPMRITFVLPGRGLAGGIRVVVVYGNRLIERGHQVTIVYLRKPWPRRPAALAQRAKGQVRRAVGLDRDHLDDFRGRLLSASADELASVVPPGDAVIATHWSTADGVAALPVEAGAKYYFLQHYEAHTFDKRLVDATWRLPMQKIVIAGWLRALARDEFDDDRAILVPNGVDTEQFDAPPREPHRPPSVGFMYSHLRWKGADVAAEAIRIARRSIPGLQAVSFGSKPPVAEMPLPENTTFHYRPEQQNIRNIYGSTDVWLCASQTEGFALPPLEAMACRCAVVCTRCGGPEDFVVEGENGYLVEVGDAQAMAERTVMMLSDEAHLKHMSDAAYATRQRYNWSRSTDLFEAALQSCTNSVGSITGNAQTGV